MVKRNFGRSELEVSPLCFGGNVFSWTINEDTSFKILDHIAAGGNFILRWRLLEEIETSLYLILSSAFCT
ncbi:hypothetical protein [Nostoc sp.]|uniref:hypothetical protein n=1 Tax=Nostoc sp. TaxID=1180 RepID=UPI002FF6BF36